MKQWTSIVMILLATCAMASAWPRGGGNHRSSGGWHTSRSWGHQGIGHRAWGGWH
jgi:ribosomal protein L2